jgi:hypothetical protein
MPSTVVELAPGKLTGVSVPATSRNAALGVLTMISPALLMPLGVAPGPAMMVKE